MSGETNLQRLLANMQPELLEGEFVFCSVSPKAFDQLRIYPIGWLRESEGITLIVERSIADDEGLHYEFVSRMITLNIHSSLEAVGFLAAITSKLAGAGISVNTISGFYHDHLFVPTDRASAVMQLLDELRNDAAGDISATYTGNRWRSRSAPNFYPFLQNNLSTENHPWEKIYKKNGRVFPEPFPRFREVLDLFIEHDCCEILDLGCGSGRHTIHLAKKKFKTFGLDISRTGLCLTREWLRDQGLESRIVQSDFRHPLPFREGSFSGVFSTQVIHHARIAAVRLAIQEIWRVLSSAGVAFISVAARKDDEEFVEIEPGTIVPLTGSEAGLPHHIFSEEELRMEFHDFQVIDVSLRADGKVLVIAARKP